MLAFIGNITEVTRTEETNKALEGDEVIEEPIGSSPSSGMVNGPISPPPWDDVLRTVSLNCDELLQIYIIMRLARRRGRLDSHDLSVQSNLVPTAQSPYSVSESVE